MAISISMSAEERDRIVKDLFLEQDVDILAVSYRHGVVRSILVLLRSLFLSREREQQPGDVIRSNTAVAVVFFRNEFEAIARAPSQIRVDHVLALDLHSLALVRQELGLLGMCREIVRFSRLALGLKGWSYIGRLCYPILGWLLFRALQSRLEGKTGVALITTNMVHPLSLGAVWAAVTTGQAADYYEHATTPRVVARDRGYREVYVQFAHTRDMLVSEGFDPRHVHALIDGTLGAGPDRGRVSSVGICINYFDSMESISEITDVLQERGLGVTYRIHDADPRYAQLARLAKHRGTGLNHAKQSSIVQFLETVDLVVAGNSNVLADAILARRQVIYYWSGRADMDDYYGLVAHHGLPRAHSRDSLRLVLDELLDAVAPC